MCYSWFLVSFVWVPATHPQPSPPPPTHKQNHTQVSARRVLALLPPPLATLNAHNLLLHLHARRGDTSGAERVLGQVLRQGLPPSLTTYNTLLQAYVRRGARARRMAGEEYKRVLQVGGSVHVCSCMRTVLCVCTYIHPSSLPNKHNKHNRSTTPSVAPVTPPSGPTLTP